VMGGARAGGESSNEFTLDPPLFPVDEYPCIVTNSLVGHSDESRNPRNALV